MLILTVDLLEYEYEKIHEYSNTKVQCVLCQTLMKAEEREQCQGTKCNPRETPRCKIREKEYIQHVRHDQL